MGIGAATSSSVRLYRDNAIATIDAVLKTVRVYPGDDVYVGFSALDVDNGGTLDKDELWCKLAVNGDDAATQMMDMVDLNGDGPLLFLDLRVGDKPSQDHANTA